MITKIVGSWHWCFVWLSYKKRFCICCLVLSIWNNYKYILNISKLMDVKSILYHAIKPWFHCIYSKLQPYFVSLLITSHPGNTILCTKRHQDDKDAHAYQLSTELKSVGQLQARGVRCMVFNATFNNISVIGWGSVLLVEETGVVINTKCVIKYFGEFW